MSEDLEDIRRTSESIRETTQSMLEMMDCMNETMQDMLKKQRRIYSLVSLRQAEKARAEFFAQEAENRNEIEQHR